MKRRYIIYALLLFLFLGALLWVYNQSYIKIVVANPQGSRVTYQVQKLGQQTTKTIQASSPAKLRLSRGSYSITTTSGNMSALTVAQSPGFMRTQTYTVSLSAEKSRSFIGDNPGICTLFTGQVLMSYECHGAFQDIMIHQPATSTMPTYTEKIKASGVAGNIQSIIQTKEGIIALVYGPSNVDDNPSVQSPLSLYKVRDNGTIAGSILVPDLTDTTPYTIMPYKDGFLLHNTSFTQVYYFSSMTAKPVVITLPQPKDKKLVPVQLAVTDNKIMTIYTSKQTTDATENGSPKVGYQIYVTEGSSSHSYNYTGNITKALFCGQQLCLLDGTTLHVFNYGKRLDLAYQLSSVTDMTVNGSSLLIVNKMGVVNFDVQSRSGSYNYTFGDYKFCDITSNISGYTLCVIDRKNNRLALQINPSQNDTTTIDKKIDQLLGFIYISKVSAYGNYIFISPNLGNTSYQSSLGIYDYDAATKVAAKNAIQSKLNEIGISQAPYVTVLNSL